MTTDYHYTPNEEEKSEPVLKRWGEPLTDVEKLELIALDFPQQELFYRYVMGQIRMNRHTHPCYQIIAIATCDPQILREGLQKAKQSR